MSRRISRSVFVKGFAGVAVLTLTGKLLYDRLQKARLIPCRTLGPSRELGHKLRDGRFGKVDTSVAITRKKVTIIGGGMAGLSAAWWFRKQGFTDFVLLELEPAVGGNSASGANKISAYPWGAHYVPIANTESVYVRTLFEELGIIQSYAADGLPVYNELYLCHDPQERLFKDGSFQEGLVPRRGLQPADRAEISRFFDIVHNLKAKCGSDGKPAFAIPLDLSSADEELRSLDRISMAEWLAQHKFNSAPLLWYVNYCCRDDYGSTPDKVSAWAGLHYFSGRSGKAANSEAYAVVTWPEGNGFLVHKLEEKNRERIITGAMVLNVEVKNGKVLTTYLKDPSERAQGQASPGQISKAEDSPMGNTSAPKNSGSVTGKMAIESDYAIFAAPRFLSKYMITDYQSHDMATHGELVYAPWLVANISLKKTPDSRGEAIAWDNVSYYSDSLGYVVATHQDITTRASSTVITYYFPLSTDAPDLARRKILNINEQEWAERIAHDLEKMHPGIRSDIISIDFWPWGHGMVRPSVGFIWGEGRQKCRIAMGGSSLLIQT